MTIYSSTFKKIRGAFYSYLMCFRILNSVASNISQLHYEKKPERNLKKRKKKRKEGKKEKLVFLVISYTVFVSTYNQVFVFL